MDFRYGLAMADNNVDDEWRRAEEGLPSSEEEEEEEEEDDEDVTATAVNTLIQSEPGDNPNSTKFSIKFENFEELPSDIDHSVTSSTFSCFGHQWRLIMYPGGEGGTAELVSVYLQRVSSGEDLMSIQFSIGINHPNDASKHSVTSRFVNDFAQWGYWGEYHFRLRSVIIDNCLVKGALTIYINMQLGEFIPKNPLTAKMLKLFGVEDNADVVFEICEQQNSDGTSDDAPKSSDRLFAHRFLLQHHSPELAALCETSEGMNPILINDIKPEVFRHLIWYVYGGGLVTDHFITSAKDLIDAADKYGVINLKLEAEVWYVHSTTITVDNVIDHLLYADAKNCALLKEAVMDFIVHNKKEVLQKVSFKDVPGDMYKDLLVAVSRYYGDDNYNDKGEEGQDDEDIDTMRISTLRRKLVSFGLDIDGSRDALISALKEFYSD